VGNKRIRIFLRNPALLHLKHTKIFPEFCTLLLKQSPKPAQNGNTLVQLFLTQIFFHIIPTFS